MLWLDDILMILAEDEKDTFFLHYVWGLPLRKVAERINLTYGAVKARKVKISRKLKALYRKSKNNFVFSFFFIHFAAVERHIYKEFLRGICMKKFAALSMSVLFALPALYIPTEREMTFADGFNGASWVNSVYTSIPFASKEDEEISIEGGMPQYYNTSSRTNTCAPVAGAIVLGYYDKTYDELIENFTSARVIMGHVLYAEQTDAVDAAMARLYTSMKTNVTEGGLRLQTLRKALRRTSTSRAGIFPTRRRSPMRISSSRSAARPLRRRTPLPCSSPSIR